MQARIVIDATRLALGGGAQLLSESAGTGQASGFALTGDTILIGDRAVVSASTSLSGQAGNVSITARTLDVSGAGAILSETSGTGDAGAVGHPGRPGHHRRRPDRDQRQPRIGRQCRIHRHRCRETVVLNGGAILSDTASTGNAGRGSDRRGRDPGCGSGQHLLFYRGRRPGRPDHDRGQGAHAAEWRHDPVARFAPLVGRRRIGRHHGGSAGRRRAIDPLLRNLRLRQCRRCGDRRDDIDLRSGSFISSASAACPDASCLATGDAGLVAIAADQLRLSDASITSTTAGVGDAGLIAIAVRDINMSGGEIATRALAGSTGIAGLVGIEATGAIVLANGATVSSDTGGRR
jgi:hypothetical protein